MTAITDVLSGRANPPYLRPPAEQGDAERDERYTRLEDFRPWYNEIRHTLDAAGCSEAPVSAEIGRWCGRGGIAPDGLAFDWDNERVWCNGPFSNIRPWIEKAWASRAVVDMLWPANRTEQPWWQDLIEPYRDRPDGVLRVRFLAQRQRFGNPSDPTALNVGSPEFGCVRLTWFIAERPPHACPPAPQQIGLFERTAQ
jgi:hypothetical protein